MYTWRLLPAVVDFVALAPYANWWGGILVDEHTWQTVTPLPWNAPRGNPSGEAYADTFELEDGRTEQVLFTHPQWVDHGIIKGLFPWTPLPDGAVFKAQVGFLHGSGGDGVTFSVWEHHLESGQRMWTPIAQVQKRPNGTLESIEVDLRRFAGQDVGIELRVDAGDSSAQDWACWLQPRIESAGV